jgi:filamentous hemagglutinin
MIGQAVREYPDGSLRTPSGKFASRGGAPAPGTSAAQNFGNHLEQNGMKVVGYEMAIEGPLGVRKYDIVVEDASGQLHGIEVKTRTAERGAYQRFSGDWINRFLG